MKLMIFAILILLFNCSNAINPLNLQPKAVDTQSILELLQPEKKNLIAGLTTEQLGTVAILANQPTETKAEPTPEPWKPLERWIYMFGSNGELIVDGDFRYEERVPDNESFSVRLNMYLAQIALWNSSNPQLSDPRCPCTVQHGGSGGGM